MSVPVRGSVLAASRRLEAASYTQRMAIIRVTFAMVGLFNVGLQLRNGQLVGALVLVMAVVWVGRAANTGWLPRLSEQIAESSSKPAERGTVALVGVSLHQ